jgi:hypothetical protein
MPVDAPAATLLVPATEAARLLSVSPRTLWGITSPRGSLPVVRIGARCLYDRSDLSNWIEAQKTK